jgi:membrane protein required for colicin V production
MNYFDCILVFPVLYGLYKGFSKGLILELASLLGLLLGVYGSVRFSSFIFEYLKKVLEIDAYYLQLASYALTFIVIVLLVTLIGKVLIVWCFFWWVKSTSSSLCFTLIF